MTKASTGERVAAYRRRRGLSQKDLAAKVGRSESWVSQVERNVQPVERLSVLQQLAAALDVSVGDLRPEALPEPSQEPAGTGIEDLDRPARVVREILRAARHKAGSGPRLAARLAELGVMPHEAARYSESAISNWIRGRTMPPADVLVAAADFARVAIEPPLRSASDYSSTMSTCGLPETVGQIQRELNDLRADVIALSERLGPG